MSTTVSTTNLPANILKLDPTGSNWVIYRIWFTRTIQSKGVYGHLDGSDVRPQSPSSTVSIAPVTVVQGPATAAGVAPQMAAPQTTAPDPATVTMYEEVLAKWEKDEALALDLITQRIPDSTVIRTVNLSICHCHVDWNC